MGNIPKDQVICKCLDLLNLSDERDKTLDFRTQKLTVSRFVKIMIEAELRQHSSLPSICALRIRFNNILILHLLASLKSHANFVQFHIPTASCCFLKSPNDFIV
ncbi:hypothetical protein FHR92_005203 [Fontibacillus solani]|uniref:Uncharacterized protein n=1 Tax=Fontibacillus solani TaxID=1572857 RepID=A0A7W3XUG5_9BACL|nr:hypothetical protein [Fontibacillus solani]